MVVRKGDRLLQFVIKLLILRIPFLHLNKIFDFFDTHDVFWRNWSFRFLCKINTTAPFPERTYDISQF